MYFPATQIKRILQRSEILFKKAIVGFIVFSTVFGSYYGLRWLYTNEWSGFGKQDSVSSTIHKRDLDGNIIQTIVTTQEPEKKLWDWLGVLGIPLTL